MPLSAAAFRARLASDEGMTLIEVMIAVFVLSVSILALASTAVASGVTLRVSRDRQNATQAASSSLESIRSLAYETVGLDVNDASWKTAPGVTTSGGTYFYDNDGIGSETVLAVPNGPVAHLQQQGPLTVRTYVTWADTAKTQKRLTTVVTWIDRGVTRSVRQSTIIAEARRGLPVPAFKIDPASQGKIVPEGTDACFDQTLTNLGEVDNYDWKPNTSGASRTTRSVSGTAVAGYSVPVTQSGFSSTWFVWTSINGQSMTERTGDDRLDSASSVGRNGSVPVTICYTRTSGSTSSAQALSFTHTFRSAFDETVTQQVTNSFTVKPVRRQYLHNDDQYTNGRTSTRRFSMSETKPTATSLTVNYDPQTGPTSGRDPYAGLRIQKGTSTDTATWDYQFASATTVGTPATATFYVSTADALNLSSSGYASAHPSGEQLSMTLQLQQLNTSRGVLATLLTKQVTVNVTSPGWKEVTVSFDGLSASFATGEYLRLSVPCDSSSAANCHIHYDVDDTADTGSRLMSFLEYVVG